MTEGQQVQVRLTLQQVIEVIGKTWHFLVLIVGFVWMVSAWKSTQDEHLFRIDEQIRITQEQLNTERDQIELENQKLDWLIRHVQSPNLPDPFPQSLKPPPKSRSQLFPLISKDQSEDARIPNLQ